MKTTSLLFFFKIALAIMFYLSFSSFAFSQDTYYTHGIGSSDKNNRNVNHTDGTKLQDLKRSAGFFLDNTVDGYIPTCSCNLLNNAYQDEKKYVSTAAHCLENMEVEGIYDGYFSFDFEMPEASERGDPTQDQYISRFYKTSYKVLVKDINSDLALIELKDYNPQLLKHAYASGWDNTVTLRTWSNISHPWGDHKKVFINNSVQNSFKPINGYDITKTVFFYEYLNFWNGVETSTEPGSSGSGHFSDQNLLKAVHSFKLDNSEHYKTYGRSYSSAISNAWYEETPAKPYFAKYLTPNNVWLNSLPGGYINDLVSTLDNENFDLVLQPSESIFTESIDKIDPRKLHKDVLWVNPLILFEHIALSTDGNQYPIWSKLMGIKAEGIINSNLVLSVYFLDKDIENGLYTERLLYGVYVNNTSNPRNPNEFEFKGDGWDCDLPPAKFQPCNRSKISGFFFGSTKGKSTEFKSEYLQDLIRINKGGFISLFNTKMPIRVRLDNIGSDIIKVQAIGYPGDVPKNALQLFKPDDVLLKFKSYKYPESRRKISTDLHIKSIEVSQGDYNKSISTGNNGGYLNLVNPNFKIGPIKTSINDINTNTLSFNINIHKPSLTTYSYRIWIDYFNKEVPDGKNDINYTYNFVDDPVVHPIELIKEGIGLTGEGISFEYTMPKYTDIALNPGKSRQTRMRISIKKGNILPNQDDTDGNGEVEDYLIELFAAPITEEIKELLESKAKIHLQGGASITDIPFPSSCPSSGPASAPSPGTPSTNQVWDVNPPFTCNTFAGSCNASRTCSSLVENDDTIDGDYVVNFIGTDDVVTVDNGDILIHNAFEERTVSFWVKKESITPDKQEVIYEEGGGTDGFAIRLNGTKVELSVLIGGQLETVASTSDISLNQWVNVTGVFNKGEIDLYIGGIEEATDDHFKTNAKTIVPAHSDNAAWGGTNGTNVWNTSLYNLDGKSYNLLIYDEALNLKEIKALATPEISSSAKNASPKTAIADNIEDPLFTIYPNPVKNYLNILVGVTQSGPLELEIRDLAGKKVYEMNRVNVDVGDHLIELRNLNLPVSIYVLSLKVGDVIRKEKIVVE